MRVELHPEARSEFRSAALWYEERREGLGAEFVGEVEQECGYGDAQFRQLIGRDGLALVDLFLEAFTVRGVANRSLVWL